MEKRQKIFENSKSSRETDKRWRRDSIQEIISDNFPELMKLIN